MLEISTVFIHILLPVSLLIVFATWPARSVLGYTLQASATGIAILALILAPVWLIPPWWTPYLFLAAWFGIIGFQTYCVKERFKRRFPIGLHAWLGFAVMTALGIYALNITISAIYARQPGLYDTVDLSMPLDAGTYIVANGGGGEILNGHFLTLEPSTPRQAAYRGQSFAVDLVQVDDWGLRADGWRPRDPERYLIFGQHVFAPCDGVVAFAESIYPDMPVPVPDTTKLEGNHVFLACGDYGVLLAHLRQGSVTLGAGDSVAKGDLIGQVGNSGQTFEPHLHLHVQRLADEGYHLSGDPLHVRLDGRFPVRNARIKVE